MMKAIDYNMNRQEPGITSSLVARFVKFGSRDKGPSIRPIVEAVRTDLRERGYGVISERFRPANPETGNSAGFTISTAEGIEVVVAGNGEHSRWVSVDATTEKGFDAISFLGDIQRKVIGGRYETVPITCY